MTADLAQLSGTTLGQHFFSVIISFSSMSETPSTSLEISKRLSRKRLGEKYTNRKKQKATLKKTSSRVPAKDMHLMKVKAPAH